MPTRTDETEGQLDAHVQAHVGVGGEANPVSRPTSYIGEVTASSPLHLRVFLASPDDVVEERRIARELVEGLAVRPAFRGKLTTEVVAYDDPNVSTPMRATETPQASVNHFSGRPSDCDLTIVILWSRLGTPVPPDFDTLPRGECRSGTLWELDDAERAHKSVLIYRRTEEPRIGLKDPAYAEKKAAYIAVEDYFASFKAADGTLERGVNEYDGVHAFRSALAQHLEVFATTWLDEARPATAFDEPRIAPQQAASVSWTWPRTWDFGPYRNLRSGSIRARCALCSARAHAAR
jgi:hypothetical protein